MFPGLLFWIWWAWWVGGPPDQFEESEGSEYFFEFWAFGGWFGDLVAGVVTFGHDEVCPELGGENFVTEPFGFQGFDVFEEVLEGFVGFQPFDGGGRAGAGYAWEVVGVVSGDGQKVCDLVGWDP